MIRLSKKTAEEEQEEEEEWLPLSRALASAAEVVVVAISWKMEG